MTEAQDPKAVASAEQLCMKIVRGLLPCNKQAVGSTALAANAIAPDGRDRNMEESRELFESICSQISAQCELLVQQNEDRVVDDERAAKAFQTVPQMQGDKQQRVQRDTRICKHCHKVGHIRRACPDFLMESHQ
jgi:hypothetical protein